MKYFKNKDILITGGAGSIGRAIVKKLSTFQTKRIRVLDQNENALFYLQQTLKDKKEVRFLVGDIKNKEKIMLAAKGVDIIIHCAALKHVPSCEYNTQEAIETNILGLKNVICAARDQEVEKCIYISTDKAVNPNNTMGITKLLGEKLIENASMGETKTKFSTVRFGNVLNSNGSVIPLFKKQIKKKIPVTITDPNMTRFFMTINDAVDLVLGVVSETKGKEMRILKMNAMKIIDLAEVLIEELSPKKMPIKIIGARPGERLYECLLTQEEAREAEEKKKSFKISQNIWVPHYMTPKKQRKTTISPNQYDSRYTRYLNKEEIRSILKKERII